MRVKTRLLQQQDTNYQQLFRYEHLSVSSVYGQTLNTLYDELLELDRKRLLARVQLLDCQLCTQSSINNYSKRTLMISGDGNIWKVYIMQETDRSTQYISRTFTKTQAYYEISNSIHESTCRRTTRRTIISNYCCVADVFCCIIDGASVLAQHFD